MLPPAWIGGAEVAVASAACGIFMGFPSDPGTVTVPSGPGWINPS